MQGDSKLEADSPLRAARGGGFAKPGLALEAWAAPPSGTCHSHAPARADLAEATGLALADFDVLAQLAQAGGELRMAELADRALISRSGTHPACHPAGR